MKTLTRTPRNRHRVACSLCGYLAVYTDSDVRVAVNDYVEHDCADDIAALRRSV